MAVHASDSAASMTAWSAAAVMHAAANSGWWFTAGIDGMPMYGWIAGMACEMLPMSVEPALRANASPKGTKVRPSDSAFRR